MRILIDGQTLSTPEIERGIGRVFLGLVKSLAIRSVSHEWVLAAPIGCDPSILGDEALDRIRIADIPAIDLAGGYERATDAHRDALERVCDDERIDLYWSPNPLMLNVVLPVRLSKVPTVCTVFDIIPARLPDTHQFDWSAPARAEYAQRIEGLAHQTEHMVFISRAAAKDFADLSPEARGKSTAIPIAVDHETFWPSAAIKAKSAHPFVLMVSGADPRKNTARAIEAFALLSRQNLSHHDLLLFIAGHFDPASRRYLEAVADAHDVPDRVRLLGRTDDDALGRLYREASAFLFPSLYEGFGLPVLEALACGTPVVVSDRPELREVAAEYGVYCDPTDPVDIAAKLRLVLEGEPKGRFDRLAAVRWAQKFTWERAADAYASVFRDVALKSHRIATIRERPRVAWASPWVPTRSGIADHSFELVRLLRERADVEIFTQSIEDSADTLGLPIHRIEKLSKIRDRFDTAIYHLGNNSNYHQKLYKAAWNHPGIVVLHDYNIHPFLHSAYFGTRDENLYRSALVESHGPDGLHHFEQVKAGEIQPGIWDYPVSSAIAKRSVATIVHSQWASGRLQQAGVENVSVISLGATSRPPTFALSRRDERLKLALPPDGFVVGVFGFLNRNKRIPSVIEACRNLRDAGYPVTLVVVGEASDGLLHLDAEIDRFDAHEFVRKTGYVDDQTYWAYLDVSDVMVNLRFPSMGESSASLMRGLGNGTPCIVSDYAQFAELPSSVCWKVSTGKAEIDELTLYLAEIMRDTEVRGTLARNAREYVAGLSSFQLAVDSYESVIYAALEGIRAS